MDKIIMSNEAYEEVQSFIQKNNITDKNVRINIIGGRCSGPTFSFTAAEVQSSDAVEEVNNINFIIRQALLDELDGFTILSSKENQGKGLLIKPFNKPKKDCRLCGRGCP